MSALTLPPQAAIVVDDNIMDGYVTVDEAARRLGRSIEQVRRYLREGRLPGRRIGLQWFIEADALPGWRPERGRAGARRIGEAVATYEAKTMRTKETKESETLSIEEWLRLTEQLSEEIRREHGEFDIVEDIRRDREEH